MSIEFDDQMSGTSVYFILMLAPSNILKFVWHILVQASNNSNYIYSSTSSVTTSPSNSSGKAVTPMSTPSTSADIHVSHGPPVIAATMPPNMSTMPPPLQYPLSPPPQFYNGNMIPPYSGDVYYSVLPGHCYPMMMNGQESYIPYYDIGEPCSNNVTPEVRIQAVLFTIICINDTVIFKKFSGSSKKMWTLCAKMLEATKF